MYTDLEFIDHNILCKILQNEFDRIFATRCNVKDDYAEFRIYGGQCSYTIISLKNKS